MGERPLFTAGAKPVVVTKTGEIIPSAWDRSIVFATGDRRFYVYEHVNLSTGEVFYVGKGCGTRAWSRSNRNRHWKYIEAAHGRAVRLVSTGLTEDEAFALEANLIKSYTPGTLATYASGGSGTSGYRHTEAARKAMSEKRKGVPMNEAARLALSERIRSSPRLLGLRSVAFSGDRNPSHKPENRAASSARMKRNNPMRDPKTRAKMSAALRGRVPSEEHRRKISDSLRGKKRGPMPDHVREKLQEVRNKRKMPVKSECGLWFESSFAAAKALGISQGSISNNCTGRTKSAGGYRWSFA